MIRNRAGFPKGKPIPYREPRRKLDTVAYVLRKLRIKQGYTHRSFSAKTGYERWAIEALECGRCADPLLRLQDFAQALGYRIAVVDAEGRAVDDVDMTDCLPKKVTAGVKK